MARVSRGLPDSVSYLLQDVAQSVGIIDYSDIATFSEVATQKQIRCLQNKAYRFNKIAMTNGDVSEKSFIKVANFVKQVIAENT